jgi:hypothetical protein
MRKKDVSKSNGWFVEYTLRDCPLYDLNQNQGRHRRTTALGQSRHFDGQPMTSDLPSEADIVTVISGEVTLTRSTWRDGPHLD